MSSLSYAGDQRRDLDYRLDAVPTTLYDYTQCCTAL